MDQAYPQGVSSGTIHPGGSMRTVVASQLFFPLFLVASAAAQDPAPPPMWPVDQRRSCRDSEPTPESNAPPRPPHPRPDLRLFATAKPTSQELAARGPDAFPGLREAAASFNRTRSSFPAPPTISAGQVHSGPQTCRRQPSRWSPVREISRQIPGGDRPDAKLVGH